MSFNNFRIIVLCNLEKALHLYKYDLYAGRDFKDFFFDILDIHIEIQTQSINLYVAIKPYKSTF